METERVFMIVAAALAFTGVALGAFGAHGLEGRLAAGDLETFETGVRYQMYHALALVGVAWAHTRWPGGGTVAAGWLFVVGVLLFSGSLYVLVLTGRRWLGAVTPLGGLAFLAGWIVLGWRLIRG